VQLAGDLGGTASAPTVPNAVKKDSLVINVLDHGVVGDGVTDDTDAINALGSSVSAGGGGTLHFPRGTYVITRGTPNVQAAGIIIYSNVEYHFDNATLVLKNNCTILSASSVLGTGVVITADTTAATDTFTVTSSAGFTVGQPVFIKLGQAAYDAGEPDHWLWANVLAIPDSTHVQIDRPCGYTMTVASVSNTTHKTIFPFTRICENWAIIGSVDLVNPMTGSANAENGLRVVLTRNGHVEKISGAPGMPTTGCVPTRPGSSDCSSKRRGVALRLGSLYGPEAASPTPTDRYNAHLHTKDAGRALFAACYARAGSTTSAMTPIR
jgi:hypothetical protein